MLSDADKRMTEITVAAFRKKIAAEKTGNPRIEYGRELLGLEQGSPASGVWFGFWLGFSAGVEFMAEESAD